MTLNKLDPHQTYNTTENQINTKNEMERLGQGSKKFVLDVNLLLHWHEQVHHLVPNVYNLDHLAPKQVKE